jgi:hypothetical protein
MVAFSIDGADGADVIRLLAAGLLAGVPPIPQFLRRSASAAAISPPR